MPEVAKRRLSPLRVWRRRSEAAGSPSQPRGGCCQLGSQGQPRRKGRASSESGVKWRRGGDKRRSGRGAEASWSGRCSGGCPSQLGPQALPVALVVAGGGWGFDLCCRPHCSETPGPCLCRSALWPCPASSALARPQPLWSAPRSHRGCPTGSREDGWTGGPGRAVLGGRASLGPCRAAGPISVLGRANWAGGRLRGPHTTVLTEGSERLSGPVISVGWYCCKIEIHRQGAH